MSEPDHLAEEVVFQAGLFRNHAVLVRGIAVAGDAEGLDDVDAQLLVLGDVTSGVGIRPGTRSGKGINRPVLGVRRLIEVEVIGSGVQRGLT